MAEFLRVSKTRIKWNRKAFAEIRTSPETNAALQTIVTDILDTVTGGSSGVATDISSSGATTRATYEGFDGGVDPGRHRSRGYVVTTTWAAMRDEAKNHTLLRALAKKAGSV